LFERLLGVIARGFAFPRPQLMLGELPAQEFFADAFVSAADLAGFLP
jgi:hypothetical protein